MIGILDNFLILIYLKYYNDPKINYRKTIFRFRRRKTIYILHVNYNERLILTSDKFFIELVLAKAKKIIISIL